MKKVTFAFCIFLLVPFLLHAQMENQEPVLKGKEMLRQAFNTWSDTDFLKSRAYFERLLNISEAQDSWLIHYYIGYSDWRLSTFYMQQDKDRALQFVDEGIDHLERCIELKSNFADAHNLLASLYSNKIGLKSILGMTLGPKSGMKIGKAMKLDESNPRNYLIAGMSAFFTPKIFGGGKDKAKEHFEKAIACFDTFNNAGPEMPDWGHEEAFAWLGLVHSEQGDLIAAENSYLKALKINQDYPWVSKVLLPNLQKKLAKNSK